MGAASAADVAAAVRWAADRGLTVAVQATGHGLTGSLDGSVLITTGRLDTVVVDPAARTARVGAGVRWRQIIDAAAPHGLAPLSGSSSGVGVVGNTLGGGLGLLSRRYGFAADHVRRAELVTADGAIRTVDAGTDPELFWALRGGKGNLGIVTELELGGPAVGRPRSGAAARRQVSRRPDRRLRARARRRLIPDAAGWPGPARAGPPLTLRPPGAATRCRSARGRRGRRARRTGSAGR